MTSAPGFLQGFSSIDSKSRVNRDSPLYSATLSISTFSLGAPGAEAREVSALIWFAVEAERSDIEVGLLRDDTRATKGCTELRSES